METILLKSGTLSDAVAKLPQGGRVVVCSRIQLSHERLPEHEGKILFTSLSDGADHRASGAALAFDSSVTLTMGGEVEFENIRIEIATSGVIAADFHPLTFGDGVFVKYDDSADANGLYLIGGENNAKNTLDIYKKDTCLCIRSGHISRLVGFSRGCADRVHTGHAEIHIGGDALVRYAVAGAIGDGARAGSAELHLSDNAVIEAFHPGGAKAENTLTGDLCLDVRGGDIYRIDASGILNVQGKKKLTYDPKTAPDGIVFLAELARFDEITSLCDIHGHELSGEYEDPFDKAVSIRKCKRCGHIELSSKTEYEKTDGVLFVSDGGFGDGSSPAYPCGSFEEAERALCGGGIIVLVGKYTLKPNITDPHGKERPSYTEPIHKGEITVSSVYGGVDYRERGAALCFAHDMDMKLSGALRIENVRITAEDGVCQNRIAARYEPIFIGEGVETSEREGYTLDVIGGYLGFSANDLDRCNIPEQYHNVICKARPLPSDFEEKTELVPIAEAPKFSLRKEAAEAFDRMLSDMRAFGLKLPTVTDAMRPYTRQYALYTGYLCRLRRTFGYSFEKAKRVVDRSCALPRTSEHHWGAAVDMYDTDLTQFSKKHHYYDITPEWAWISEHGWEYGIILRYGADQVGITTFIYEPWHFRYVGRDAAYVISRRGITLEEYAGALYGAFDLDSHVTVLSGSYNKVSAFSQDTGLIQLTGKHFVTVGDKVKLKIQNNDASEC